MEREREHDLKMMVLAERLSADDLRELTEKLLAALFELHAIDERKLEATQRRVYAIGVSVIRERVERNRALIAQATKAIHWD